jgi:hypothetical protein
LHCEQEEQPNASFFVTHIVVGLDIVNITFLFNLKLFETSAIVASPQFLFGLDILVHI